MKRSIHYRIGIFLILLAPAIHAQNAGVISNLPPVVRIGEPISGSIFQLPANIAIFAVPEDRDGSVESVEFFTGTNSLGVVTNSHIATMSPINPWHLFWTNPPPGIHALRAKATDNLGAVGWSEPVRITVLGPDRQTVVTVVATDAEAEEIPLVPPGMGMPQRDNPAVFTISRAGETNDSLTVYFSLGGSASNGVDYAKVGDSVTIPAGAISAEVTIDPIDDFLVEGTETVALKIEPPICPAIFPPPPGCYLVGVPGSALAYIRDNDTNSIPPPTVVSVVATDPEAEEIPLVPPWLDIAQRYNPAVFTFSRTGNTNDPLIVYYRIGGTASNGEDYAKIESPIIIPAGALSADLTIDPIDDSLTEGTETVIISLEPIACPAIFPSPPGCYQIGASRSAVAFIRDNDSNAAPKVVLTQPAEGADFPYPSIVHIEADVTDPDGYSSHVEFFANGVKIGEETIAWFVEPPPGQTTTFSFDWKGGLPGRYELTARALDNTGTVGVSGPVHITISGTNTPPLLPIVTITAVDSFASEGGSNSVNIAGAIGVNTAAFAIRRSGPTNASLLLTYRIGGTASNGVDYQELPGFVTIPAGERGTRILVTPIDDKIAEGPESVVLSLTIPPSPLAVINPPPPYIIGYPGRAAAVIADNDGERPPTRCLSDGLFHGCWPGTNGFGYRIELSTNLINWTSVCTNIVTDGAIHFIDPDTSDFEHRFYRAAPEPNVPLE
jgi:hypothetical protein